MAPLPCAGKSQPSPCQEMEEALVLMDVQGQIKYLKHRMIVTGIPAMNPMPALLNPLHSPSKNAGVYENEDEHGLPLQRVSDYEDPFLS